MAYTSKSEIGFLRHAASANAEGTSKFQICGSKGAISEFTVGNHSYVQKRLYVGRFGGSCPQPDSVICFFRSEVYIQVWLGAQLLKGVWEKSIDAIRTFGRSNDIRNPVFFDILAKKVTKSKI